MVRNHGLAHNGLAALETPISAEAARQACLSEVPHRDPLDRLLAAEAVAADLVMASNGGVFSPFDGGVRLN